MNFEMKDISREVFGKYQFCTMVEGRWYSDEDFSAGRGCGTPKVGSVAQDGFVYLGKPPLSWARRLFRSAGGET